MNIEQAVDLKKEGVQRTSQDWIKKIEGYWTERLERGWDTLWIPALDDETEEVQVIVAKHFLEKGYGFQTEMYYGMADYPQYRMRLSPLQQELGLFRQILTRIFGGAFA